MDDILKGLNVRHRFRDPLYGFIELTEAEKRIVDTPLFQRLRRIHQLALTKYVYPTAEHSRFVHSLGVVHSATAIFSGLLSNSRSDLPTIDILNSARLLRFAALLHDIGHLPFSHAAEKAWINPLSHEHISSYIIENYDPIRSILMDEEVEPKTVSSLLNNNYRAKHKILHEVISGYLDADRADYLLRDSYCCGVKYGEYDFNRYIRIFGAKLNGNELALTVHEKDVYIAESFLLARYHYNIQVPFHRTRSGYDCILNKYLETSDNSTDWYTIDKINNNFAEIDFDKLETLDDYYMFEQFKRAAKNACPWAKMLLRQEHLRTIFDTTSSILNGKYEEDFRRATTALKDSGVLEENNDFFIKIQKVDLIKIPDGYAGKPLGEQPNPLQTVTVECPGIPSNGPTLLDITSYSWIFNRLATDPPRLLRIFVTPDKQSQAERILASAGNLREKVA